MRLKSERKVVVQVIKAYLCFTLEGILIKSLCYLVERSTHVHGELLTCIDKDDNGQKYGAESTATSLILFVPITVKVRVWLCKQIEVACAGKLTPQAWCFTLGTAVPTCPCISIHL